MASSSAQENQHTPYYFYLQLKPAVTSSSAPTKFISSDVARKVYQKLKDDLQTIERAFAVSQQVDCFHLVNLKYGFNNDYITLSCFASDENEFDKLYELYREGSLSRKFSDYLESIGITIELGINPTDVETKFQCFMVLDQKSYTDGKSHFLGTLNPRKRITTSRDDESTKRSKSVTVEKSGDINISVTCEKAPEIYIDKNLETEAPRKLSEKMFRVYVPCDYPKGNRIMWVRLKSSDCPYVDGKPLQNVNGTNVWEARIPCSTAAFFSYRYSYCKSQRRKFGYGQYSVDIPLTEAKKEKESIIFFSKESDFQIDVVLSTKKSDYLEDGLYQLIWHTLHDVTSEKLEVRIKELEVLADNISCLILKSNVELTKRILDSLENFQNFLFSEAHCLLTVVFLASSWKNCSYLESCKCVTEYQAKKILEGCSTASLDVVEKTNCTRSSIQAVLQQLSSIATGSKACFMEFFAYAYPLLPLEYFMYILKETVGRKEQICRNETTKDVVKTVVFALCKEAELSCSVGPSPHGDALEKMQRHLPLHHQITVLDCLEEICTKQKYSEKFLVKSKEVLQSQCVIKVQEAGRNEDVSKIVLYCNLMMKRNLLVDSYVFLTTLQKTVLALIQKGRTVTLEKENKQIQELCLSGFIFQEHEEKMELLRALANSGQMDVHYIFIVCIQNSVFGVTFTQQLEDLVQYWFEKAIERHCWGRRANSSDFIVQAYSYLGDLLCIQKLSQKCINGVQTCAFDHLCKFELLAVIHTISKIESLQDTGIEEIYKQHVQKLLYEKLNGDIYQMTDLVEKICGRGCKSITINSELTLTIWKTLIECTGIAVNMSVTQTFKKVLEYNLLWMQLLRSKGKRLKELADFELYKAAVSSIQEIGKSVEEGKVECSVFLTFQNRWMDSISLISLASGFEEKKVQKLWRDFERNLAERQRNLDILCNVLEMTKGHVRHQHFSTSLRNCQNYTENVKADISQGHVRIVDVEKCFFQLPHLRDLIETCCSHQRVLHSQVFWNLFHQRETSFYARENFAKCVEEDDEIITSIAGLFEEADNELTEVDTTMEGFLFLDYLIREGLKLYREFWIPLLQDEDASLPTIMIGLMGIDLEEEVKTADAVCGYRIKDHTKKSLECLLEHDQYAGSVAVMKEALDAFNIDYQTDQEFTNAVSAYEMLRKEKSESMTLFSIKNSLVILKSVSLIIKEEVRLVLDQMIHASSLIEFLKTVVDDDIRNLIDAVEEHSEQYVRESTVSDLIDVKSFFMPLLKENFTKDARKFFSVVKKSVESSGIKGIPAKIYECSSSLHSLKALYDHVANRGEITKEIIENIVNRGKFYFSLYQGTCEVSVEYKHFKQDKGHAKYTTSALSDLRSRALLIMNSEEKQRKEKQLSLAMKKEVFPKFVQLVDVCLSISSLCTLLRKSGHYKYITFDEKVNSEKSLMELQEKLQGDLEVWGECLRKCRKDFYYMNFIHGDQIRLLFQFMKDGKEVQSTLTLLRYIHPYLRDISEMQNEYAVIKGQETPQNVLTAMGKAIHHVLQNIPPSKKIFPIKTENVKATEIVQEGKPYLAALEEGSSLVIRTLLSLFMNTTGEFPLPYQIVFCCRDTSFEELKLLLNRCLGSKIRDLFCVANIDKLSTEVQFQLAEELMKLPSESKFLLALICRGSLNHPFIDQFSDIVLHPRPMTELQLRTCFETQWESVTTVTSDVPGLGKSEEIHREAARRGKSVLSLHLSGKVVRKTLIARFVTTNPKSYNLLHIDIGVIEEPDDLDVLLFEVIITGYIAEGATTFSLTTEHISIEIANTVSNKLRDCVPTLTSFRRLHLKWEDFSNMRISNEICSPVQVVCAYLQALECSMLDQKDLYFSQGNGEKPLSAVCCRDLLRKYFSNMTDMSFSVVNVFVNVLADQLKKMSTSMFFRTSNLEHPSARTQLVRALVEMSKDFASRSVHSCRSVQYNAMTTEKPETKEAHQHYTDQSSAAEILAKRVEGMIRWEDGNHLLVLFHDDMNTVTALYRNLSKVPLHIRKLFESQLSKPLEVYERKGQGELQNILQKLVSCKSRSKEVLAHQKKLLDSYALTPDNLLKMILIYLRIKAHEPVIIMGETGCGKTSLVRFLAANTDVCFDVLSIHAGTTEEKIISTIEKCNKKARGHLSKLFWLFLDEINTCDHLGLISDILCHHRCLGKMLLPNLTVIAACNPYRLRHASEVFTSGLQGKIKMDELSRLVYRVHPLPESLVDYVWDYGNLNDVDEGKYIDRMIGSLGLKGGTDLISNLLKVSQRFVRQIEGSTSSVSLRDVERCKRLFIWFKEMLRVKQSYTGSFVPKFTAMNDWTFVEAVVLSLAVCYHSRFADNDIRRKYRQELFSEFRNSIYAYFIKNDDDILKMISLEQNDILNRMDLPEGIAKNTALRENVFVIFVCVLNRIPVFVVGKPGCSKSLSMQLIRSNLRGKDSRDPFFKTLPQLYCVSFQGSESSTSDGIIKVFDKAKNYQNHNSSRDVMSVVILDEIGLAEISRFNPLKVLHSLLEPEDSIVPDVAVVGISNWALDAAKMNRAIHLSRPEMDFEELFETGMSISMSLKTKPQMSNSSLLISRRMRDEIQIDREEENLLRGLALAYGKYQKQQKHKNFHGLRDFYSLTKFVSYRLSQVGPFILEEEKRKILLHGILRNLGGLADMTLIESIYSDCIGVNLSVDFPVTMLIENNIQDKAARHLMLITSGDSVIGVLENILRKMNRNHIVIFGSQFEDDMTDEYYYRILSRIILCMEQGFCLILKDLENIYGSLYDMLNQNYTVVGNKKNCRVALGPYSNPMCHVHDDFKCIVIVEESKLDYSDPPFLNRFEKQLFRFSEMIDKTCEKLILRLERFIEEMRTTEYKQFSLGDTFSISTDDLLPSLVLSVTRDSGGSEEDIFLECLKKLMWITYPETIVRLSNSQLSKTKSPLVKQLVQFYKALPIHDGVSAFLGQTVLSKMEDTNAEEKDSKDDPIAGAENEGSDAVTFQSKAERTVHKLFAVFTHSNIHMNVRSLFHGRNVQCERLSSFKSEKDFSTRVQQFYVSEKEILFIQLSVVSDSPLILLAKSTVEEMQRKYKEVDKFVIMVFHLERTDSESKLCYQVHFLTEWKLALVDTLEKPETGFCTMVDSSAFEILTHRRPITETMKSQLFWSLTRIQFTGRGHSLNELMNLLSLLQDSAEGLSLLEDAIFDWITENSKDENWQHGIAGDEAKLKNAGSFIRALELHLLEIIKIPLAMLFYKLLEMNALHCILKFDESDGSRNVWREVLKSEVFFSLKDIPEPKYPECYSCSTNFLDMTMPFSYPLILKTEELREDFMELKRQVKIACEIDAEGDEEMDSIEELPEKLFQSLVAKYQDIVIQSIPEIHSLQYVGNEKDYISDFSNFVTSYQTNLDIQERIFATKWSLEIFSDLSTCNFDELTPKLHMVNWTYGSIVTAMVQSLEIVSKSRKITCYEVIEMIEKKEEAYCDEIPYSFSIRSSFVNTLSSLMLPTGSCLLHFESVTKWQAASSKLLPMLCEISLDAPYLHMLRLCGDLSEGVFIPYSISARKLEEISELLLELERMDVTDVYSSIMSFLQDLTKSRKDVEAETVQKVVSQYINRCVAFDTESSIIEKVFDSIAEETFLNESLSLLGPVLHQYLHTELAEEDLVTLPFSETFEENQSRFLYYLDKCLRQLGESGRPDSPLATLVVDILQEEYKCVINPESLSQIDSMKDSIITSLFEADKVLRGEEYSFRLVASVAITRQALLSLVMLSDDISDLSVLSQNMNVIISRRDNTSVLDEYRSQTVLVYFLRCIWYREGIAITRKRVLALEKAFPAMESFHLDLDVIKTFPLFQPLLQMTANSTIATDILLSLADKKVDPLKQLCSDALLDSSKLLSLLCLMLHSIFLPCSLLEFTDTARDLGEKIYENATHVNFSSCCREIFIRLLKIKDFESPYFHLTPECLFPQPQIVSILLHLMCTIVSHGGEGNLWYDSLVNPGNVQNRLKLFLSTSSVNASLPELHLCMCGQRYISKNNHCPGCQLSSESAATKLSKTTCFFTQCENSDRETTTSFQEIMYFLLHGCLLASFAIKVCNDNILEDLIHLDSNDIVQDLENRWRALREYLHMNDDDLCGLFHILLMRCRNVLTGNVPPYFCRDLTEQDQTKKEMIQIVTSVLRSRFQSLRNFRKEQCRIANIDTRGLECQVLELPDIEDSDEVFNTLPSLFRLKGSATKENLLCDLELLPSGSRHPFLLMVLKNLEKLVLPKFIVPLFRWHAILVNFGSYKIRKVECGEVSVSKLISLETDEQRRYHMKKRFEAFKEAWNCLHTEHMDTLKVISGFPTEFMQVSINSKVIECSIVEDDSILLGVIQALVSVQNSLIDASLQMAMQERCRCLAYLYSNDNTVQAQSVPLSDIKTKDIIDFEWDENLLRFSQCRTSVGLGQQVDYDFDKIEREVAHDLLNGKSYISCQDELTRMIFIDELFQNSILLMKYVGEKIPQENLTTEIIKGLQSKMKKSRTYIHEFQTQLGMILTILKKTGGNSSTSLVDYLEGWSFVISQSSYKQLLPEPENSIKLCHVVNVYKWLEEKSGEQLVEDLEDALRTDLTREGKDMLVKCGSSHVNHLVCLGQSLKVFVHRCLSTPENAVKPDQPLFDYLMDVSFWPSETFYDGVVHALFKGTRTPVPLEEILSHTLLVEHVYEIIVLIQKYSEMQRTRDTTVSDISSSYKASKTTTSGQSKKKSARKFGGKT